MKCKETVLNRYGKCVIKRVHGIYYGTAFPYHIGRSASSKSKCASTTNIGVTTPLFLRQCAVTYLGTKIRPGDELLRVIASSKKREGKEEKKRRVHNLSFPPGNARLLDTSNKYLQLLL